MKHAGLLWMSLVLGGCSAGARESRALHEEAIANERSQLGDGTGAERARRRADALWEAARLRSQRHGRLWHDLAMD